MRSCVFLLLFFVVEIFGCENPSNENFYQLNQKEAIECCDTARLLIKTGDIITRSGMDFTSTSLAKLNTRDNTYSHIGIASIENGIIYIYHCIGGEANPNQTLKRETLSHFVNGRDNKGFGIFRFSFDSGTIRLIQQNCQKEYLQKIPFDMAFDWKTDDKMYCSEFVAKTIQKVLHKSAYFPLDTLSGKVYMAPDAIFLHRDCHEIKRLRYF